MYSLYIDTHFTDLVLALLNENGIVDKKVMLSNKHSEYTINLLNDLLNDNNIGFDDIKEVIVINGPGSFTGVRIGVTIAKTYGYLIKKDITLVSSLKALAISSLHDGVIMSVIPANKSNYYVGVYDKDYNILYNEEFVSNNKLLELCNQFDPYIVSVDANVIGKYKMNKTIIDVKRVVEYYKDKDKVNYHSVVPNYLKLPQALEDRK